MSAEKETQVSEGQITMSEVFGDPEPPDDSYDVKEGTLINISTGAFFDYHQSLFRALRDFNIGEVTNQFVDGENAAPRDIDPDCLIKYLTLHMYLVEEPSFRPEFHLGAYGRLKLSVGLPEEHHG